MTHHASSTRHPRWCSPRRCSMIVGETRHSSLSTRVTTTEQSIDLSVVTYDPDAEPTILMGVANQMHTNQDAQLVLRPNEARTLAEQLLIHYLKTATPRIPAQRTKR